MRRILAIIGACLLALGACGDGDGTQPVAVGSSDAAGSGTGEVIEPADTPSVYLVEVPGRDLAVSVKVRPSYRRPPNELPRGAGETLLHQERWLDRDTGRAIGWSVQVDPGDDANLFRFEVIDTFDTPLGSWTVHELGEDMFTHYMAMVRHDGLVFQVIGGAPDAPAPVLEMAQSMEVTR